MTLTILAALAAAGLLLGACAADGGRSRDDLDCCRAVAPTGAAPVTTD